MSRTQTPVSRPAVPGTEGGALAPRRRGALVAGLTAFAVVAGLGAAWLLRGSGGHDTAPPSGPSRLVVVAVRADPEPLLAVVGSIGKLAPAAVVIPAQTVLTIPGHGDGTAGDAAALPGRSLATTVSNALGAWIDHFAVTDAAGLGRIIDREGGIQIELPGTGGASPSTVTFSGSQVVEYLSGTEGPERVQRWQQVLGGLLARRVSIEEGELAEVDDVRAVERLLAGARGASVQTLPVTKIPGGLLRPDGGGVRGLMASAFGLPDRAPVAVIVLNGSGAPGVGEAVAERLVPAGFRIVSSDNAARFNHGVTSIVVTSEADRALAERVREALGVGEITISGLPSGLGDVTIVVGKDFASG